MPSQRAETFEPGNARAHPLARLPRPARLLQHWPLSSQRDNAGKAFGGAEKFGEFRKTKRRLAAIDDV
jgi:hypothetical protein